MRRGLIVGLVVVMALGVQAQAPPTLTPLEQERIKNVNLLDELRKALADADTCHGLLAQPRAAQNAQQVKDAVEALKRDIDAAHPGFTWSPTTGAFEPVAK